MAWIYHELITGRKEPIFVCCNQFWGKMKKQLKFCYTGICLFVCSRVRIRCEAWAPLSFLCLTAGLCLQLYWSENVRWPNYQWVWTISEREFFNFSLIWEIHLNLQKVHSHIVFFNRYTKDLGSKSTLLRFQKNVNIQVSKKRKYFKALGSKLKNIQPG